MQILVNLVVSAIAVLITAHIVHGVTLDSFFTAIVVAVVLGIVNALVKPIIKLLTLPINFLTLGLFSFVISALMVLFTDFLVSGFEVEGFMAALIFGVVLSVVNWGLDKVNPTK